MPSAAVEKVDVSACSGGKAGKAAADKAAAAAEEDMAARAVVAAAREEEAAAVAAAMVRLEVTMVSARARHVCDTAASRA
jgi:hypothetical protein